MNTNQLTVEARGDRAWWYVRPHLLAVFGLLFLMCVLVWILTREYLANVQPLTLLGEGVRVLTLVSDATTRLALNCGPVG